MDRATWTLAVVALLSSSALHAQARPLKLFVSVDMEGVVGVVTADQLNPAGFEYQRFREYMTEEALSAIRAARAAGAGEILVSDSHGNGENLLIDKFPDDVTIVRGWPRQLMWMQGIDSTFDGVIFLGYHASTTNPDGVRAHTISSARLADVRFGGRSMSEGGIAAAVAGQYGVPVIMISGDDAAVSEVRAMVGDIEGAITKWHYSFHSARTIPPAASYQLIAEKTSRAVQRLKNREFKPFVVPTPVNLEVRFKAYRPPELLSYLTIVERVDAHSVRYMARTPADAMRFLEFITNYNVELEP